MQKMHKNSLKQMEKGKCERYDCMRTMNANDFKTKQENMPAVCYDCL